MHWTSLRTAEPDLTEAAETYLTARTHLTMATLRADGAPRLCGTELRLWRGDWWLAGMPGSRRFADLRRDPRVAVHSGSAEPDVWTGDARLAGLAVETTDPALVAAFLDGTGGGAPSPAAAELFRVDVTEVTVVQLDEARTALVVDTWRQGHGRTRSTRA